VAPSALGPDGGYSERFGFTIMPGVGEHKGNDQCRGNARATRTSPREKKKEKKKKAEKKGSG